MNKSGFSLIELMVVIAIVAILAAVAVPGYRNYIIRAKVASVFPLMEVAKNNVQALHNDNVIFGPRQLPEWRLIKIDTPNKPEEINEINFGYYGVIVVEFNTAYLGLDPTKVFYVALVPQEGGNGVIKWVCAYHGASFSEYNTYLPKDCQSQDWFSIYDPNF